MNFIGIRILNNRDASQFIRRYSGSGTAYDSYDNIMKVWRKIKAFTIKTLVIILILVYHLLLYQMMMSLK